MAVAKTVGAMGGRRYLDLAKIELQAIPGGTPEEIFIPLGGLRIMASKLLSFFTEDGDSEEVMRDFRYISLEIIEKPRAYIQYLLSLDPETAAPNRFRQSCTSIFQALSPDQLIDLGEVTAEEVEIAVFTYAKWLSDRKGTIDLKCNDKPKLTLLPTGYPISVAEIPPNEIDKHPFHIADFDDPVTLKSLIYSVLTRSIDSGEEIQGALHLPSSMKMLVRDVRNEEYFLQSTQRGEGGKNELVMATKVKPFTGQTLDDLRVDFSVIEGFLNPTTGPKGHSFEVIPGGLSAEITTRLDMEHIMTVFVEGCGAEEKGVNFCDGLAAQLLAFRKQGKRHIVVSFDSIFMHIIEEADRPNEEPSFISLDFKGTETFILADTDVLSRRLDQIDFSTDLAQPDHFDPDHRLESPEESATTMQVGEFLGAKVSPSLIADEFDLTPVDFLRHSGEITGLHLPPSPNSVLTVLRQGVWTVPEEPSDIIYFLQERLFEASSPYTVNLMESLPSVWEDAVALMDTTIALVEGDNKPTSSSEMVTGLILGDFLSLFEEHGQMTIFLEFASRLRALHQGESGRDPIPFSVTWVDEKLVAILRGADCVGGKKSFLEVGFRAEDGKYAIFIINKVLANNLEEVDFEQELQKLGVSLRGELDDEVELPGLVENGVNQIMARPTVEFLRQLKVGLTDSLDFFNFLYTNAKSAQDKPETHATKILIQSRGPVFQLPETKLKVGELVGVTREQILTREKSVLVGVSLGNRFFNLENLRAYIYWAINHTRDRVAVLIPDQLHAINIQYKSSRTTPARAMRLAKKHAKEVSDQIEHIRDDLTPEIGDLLDILFWEDVSQGLDKYHLNIAAINEAFRTSKDRKDGLYFESMGFVEGFLKSANRLDVPHQRREALCRYFLEELSVLIGGLDYRFEGEIRTAELLPYPYVDRMQKLILAIQKGEKLPDLRHQLITNGEIAFLGLNYSDTMPL